MGQAGVGFRVLMAGVLASFAGACPAAEADPHAGHHHHQDVAAAPLARSQASYAAPRVELLREDGVKVDLAAELAQGGPVYLNFIYTSCTAICPVMSQIFAGLQDRLGERRGQVRMISVSIDPEQDTPRRLAEYARQYRAGPQWHFYTGTPEASVAVQKAFQAYRVDKMNHTLLTLFRPAPGRPWVRLDGFVTPELLAGELARATP